MKKIQALLYEKFLLECLSDLIIVVALFNKEICITSPENLENKGCYFIYSFFIFVSFFSWYFFIFILTNIFFVFYVRSFENLYQRSAAFDVFFNDCTFICCWWSATTLFLKKKDNFFLFFPRWISKIKLAMFQGPASTMLTFLGKIQKCIAQQWILS